MNRRSYAYCIRVPLLVFAVLLVSFQSAAFARTPDATANLPNIRFLDANGAASDIPRAGQIGIFSAAQAGTTFFGGTVWAADSARWEADSGRALDLRFRRGFVDGR